MTTSTSSLLSLRALSVTVKANFSSVDSTIREVPGIDIPIVEVTVAQ